MLREIQAETCSRTSGDESFVSLVEEKNNDGTRDELVEDCVYLSTTNCTSGTFGLLKPPLK